MEHNNTAYIVSALEYQEDEDPAKNRNEDYGQAVDEWSRDRDYVKQKYGSSYSC